MGPRGRQPDPLHAITLVRADRAWRFACEPGAEPALLAELDRLALDPTSGFERDDAAAVAFQLGRNAASQNDTTADHSLTALRSSS